MRPSRIIAVIVLLAVAGGGYWYFHTQRPGLLAELVLSGGAGEQKSTSGGPAEAQKESLQPGGTRFILLSELSSLGEEKTLLLRGCANSGPGDIQFRRIRKYFDPGSQMHLWIIQKLNRKEVLYYSSTERSCTIIQQD
jgi:hypothetical protein